ncbi:glycoside hydrolase family 3 C-terminal domain-containing protein [Telmatobacter sp. DSM 110680]|uniref:Glycoside hydrolase family 3 C-terminal domain-containing protein n=1 Tax=Telmatobacter sp. DSM 110680 TaxID=3036704 RepID=A0AAU7DGZ4_9BACT
MKRRLVYSRLALLLSALLLLAFNFAQSTPSPAQNAPTMTASAPYKNTGLPVDQRVADLLKSMTIEEKASMLAGSGWMESAPIERLGIPAIKMADGPMGVRSWAGSSAITNSSTNTVKVQTTSFPSGVAMAATWDPALVQREGQAIAQEVKALGRDMILGPTVNINRVPLWGRNLEGYGEDPYLSGQLGVAYIRGVQGEGVIPSVKHFAANNEEFERHRLDEKIDERTLHELYLPAFKMAVQQADVWTVMSAYEKVNGQYCAENPYLLTDILKKEFGFKGFVISDWGSTYSTAPTVNAGMDLEMPGGPPAKAMLSSPRTIMSGNSGAWLEAGKVLAEVKAGHISEATLNDNVGRILRVIMLSGIMEHPHTATGEVDTPEQQKVARDGATEGIVLLKNQGSLLPLDPSKIHSIAVIGPNAIVARTGGGGSSLVRPKYAVSPLDGIKKRAGEAVQISSALGVGMEGEDAAHDTPEARENDLKVATDAASKAEVAVVVVGRYNKNESEGFDVKTMDLPAGQDELIAAVEKANPHTVVVLNTGDPVTMTRWLDTTPALLDMWYGGQEGGNALASILFGDANPSGKLPVSLPKKFEDSPAAKTYPGQNLHTEYTEGLYVGYRYYDTKNVEPQFPFGFGLSYTTFEYSDLKVIPFTTSEGTVKWGGTLVSLKVKNSGSRAGAEVVQIYVHDAHAKIDRPAHELKAFGRVELKPGESQTIKFQLDRSAFEYWSPQTKVWTLDPGTFEIQVGASSRDIRLKAPVKITH